MIQEIEERYKIILDSITDGVFTVDHEFRIASFNRAAEKITGVPRGAAIKRPCHEVFKADVCKNGCILKKAMDTQRPVLNIPIHITRADQRRIPIAASAALLKDSKGKLIGGVETFRDLTVYNQLRRALLKEHSFADILSKNPKMQRIFSVLPQVAESGSTVLIRGDSGTGKELIARAIHNHSPMKEGPFIAVNCGALPDSLCESELFGYKAGAFTDAKRDKPGRFALAQNGSIFLDEIGDMSRTAQMRLLRVLEEKVFEPLGSTRKVRTNARVIAATHRNLEDLVKEGKFREDLYYRINVIKIYLPPLLERKEDIPLLVDHFLERLSTVSGRRVIGVAPEGMAALMLHDWSGNVRELENSIEHAFVLCRGEIIELAHLPENVQPANASLHVPTGLTLVEIEKRAIEQALERNCWRKVATARELGIDKNTLRRKIMRLDISEP